MRHPVKKSKLQKIQEHNHDIRQRLMVETASTKKRSTEHQEFLEMMVERGEELERSIMLEMAESESAAVIGVVLA